MKDYTPEEIIGHFHDDAQATHRYASYDFCYGYFQQNKGTLASPEKIEQSCFILWGYLASWGMLRGSSWLLQCSPAALVHLIKVIDSEDMNWLWDFDVPNYPGSEKKLIEAYKTIATALEKIKPEKAKKTEISMTLITKIMLGVYGVIPAYDQNFCKCFGSMSDNSAFTRVNQKSLTAIWKFYNDHKDTLDSIKYPVVAFDGQATALCYKIAKLIDMYGFTVGDIMMNEERKLKRVKPKQGAQREPLSNTYLKEHKGSTKGSDPFV